MYASILMHTHTHILHITLIQSTYTSSISPPKYMIRHNKKLAYQTDAFEKTVSDSCAEIYPLQKHAILPSLLS